MPKVYAPQIPTRFDMITNTRVPLFDMNSATAFGDLVSCVPGDADFTTPLPQVIEMLEAALVNFSDDDYLMAIGDPTLIAAAAIICSLYTEGRMKMLRWNKRERRYIAVEFTV